MKKFIPIIYSFLFFFLLNLSFPTLSFAQQCDPIPYQPSTTFPDDVCKFNPNVAGGGFFNQNCEKPTLACQLGGNLCKKYTGQQCCTTNPAGGLGYDFCQQTSVVPDGGLWKHTIQCCFNPPPTPTPTP